MPDRLRGCQVLQLHLNMLIAGTMFRGMFEDRIENIISELKERHDLILFVDEAHTLIGAGCWNEIKPSPGGNTVAKLYNSARDEVAAAEIV